MDIQNAKPAQDYVAYNVPLLPAEQQSNNQYYAPQVQQTQQQQQINQQPYFINPYQPLNIQADQQQQQQQQQQKITGIVIQSPYIPYTPQVVQNASGSRTPVLLQCCFCNQHSVTTITYKPGNNTYWVSLLLCLFFGCLCFIPLLSGDCKDVYHQCSYCGKVVGHTPYKPCS